VNTGKPYSVIVIGESVLRRETGFWVRVEQRDRRKQRAAFVDNALEPTKTNFEIAETPCPMGVNLRAKTIELNGHTVSSGIKKSKGRDQIQTGQSSSRTDSGVFKLKSTGF
jgi:hypothetical protein